MATAASQPWAIPSNEDGGPRSRLMFQQDRLARVTLDSGDIVDLPLGTKMVVALPRREMNDFYCEILGNRHVSGTGTTKDDAFHAALAQAA